MAGRVLVTGGSGFIAGYVIRQLIGEGWQVHTTIRSLAREDQVRAALSIDNDRLHFFAADLMSDDGWHAAAERCSHVAHIASPLPAGGVRHPDDLIVPAREGALRALRAARDAGAKRFVMTSSVAAIAYGNRSKSMFTEADWTDVTSPDAYPYVQSKTLAERAARDWVAQQGGGMEFCTVNPALVLGPVLNGDYSASVEVVSRLLNGSIPGLPRIGFGIVDVRDVADLHVRCLTAPNMAGERFIASDPFIWMEDVARILREEFGEAARRVPKRRLPDFLVRIGARFDPMVRQVVTELGNVRGTDASHAKAVLGWVPRPARDSIIDTARSLIDKGLVKAP